MCRAHHLPQLTKRNSYEEATGEILQARGAGKLEAKHQPDVASTQLKRIRPNALVWLAQPFSPISAHPAHATTLRPTEVMWFCKHFLPVHTHLPFHGFFFLTGVPFLLHPPGNAYLTSLDSPKMSPPFCPYHHLQWMHCPQKNVPITLLTVSPCGSG